MVSQTLQLQSIFQVSQVPPAAVAQWIALAAHGQWAVGSEPIKVIVDVRKGIRP